MSFSLAQSGPDEVMIDEFCVLQRVNEESVMLRVNETAITNTNVNNDSLGTLSLQARNDRIKSYLANIQALSPKWLQDYIVSYDSLLLVFDSVHIDFYAVVKFLKTLNNAEINAAKKAPAFLNDKPKTHVIEVCYTTNDEEYPNDMSQVQQITGLNRRDIVKLHQSKPYQVFAIGFMPHFAYLGELPDALNVPRLSKPRLRVPAGAVAIADTQTAVYPSESPGGWHIIGYTTFAFGNDGENTITPADSVKFSEVSEEVFQKQKRLSLIPNEKVNIYPHHNTQEAKT